MAKNEWEYCKAPDRWVRTDGVKVRRMFGEKYRDRWMILAPISRMWAWRGHSETAQAAMSAADKEIPMGERTE